MKIKINEYSKGMRFLTSDQGDYSPNAPDIFVQEKPNYRMPSLELGFQDGGRVGFDNGGGVRPVPKGYINLVELVNQALGFVKTKEYDEAMAIYKSILKYCIGGSIK
jgi:hypothetical protein